MEFTQGLGKKEDLIVKIQFRPFTEMLRNTTRFRLRVAEVMPYRISVSGSTKPRDALAAVLHPAMFGEIPESFLKS
jgi:hypothetical protein